MEVNSCTKPLCGRQETLFTPRAHRFLQLIKETPQVLHPKKPNGDLTYGCLDSKQRCSDAGVLSNFVLKKISKQSTC